MVKNPLLVLAVVIAVGLLVTVVVLIAMGNEAAVLLVPLLVGGGMGGLTQALIAGKGGLDWPGWSPDSKKYETGFVADLIIGVVGAIGSLLLGLAVLNDRFFREQAPSPASNAVVPANKDGGGGTDRAAFPVGVVPTWIRIFSFGALTGFASRRLLPEMSDRLARMIAGEVKQRTEEVRKEVERKVSNQAENIQSQAQIFQATIGSLTGAEPRRAAATQTGAEPQPAAVLGALAGLVSQYDAISEPDYSKRLAAKQRKAEEILDLILRNRLTSAEILQRATAETSDAWVLALASLVAAKPQPGDAARLLQAADQAKRLHIKYRVLLALFALRAASLLGPTEVEQAKKLVQSFLPGADDSLKRKAEATLDLLNA